MAKIWPLREAPIERRSLRIADLGDGTYPARPDGMSAQHSPGRDDAGLAPTEDVNRELDGVPHDIVGLSALFSVLFAAVVLGMWLSGSTGRIAAVAMCMVGIPMLVSNLRQRADRERNREHPSR